MRTLLRDLDMACCVTGTCRVSTQKPVAPLICPRGHGEKPVKATTFDGEIVVYCDKCKAVIDRRSTSKSGQQKPS